MLKMSEPQRIEKPNILLIDSDISECTCYRRSLLKEGLAANFALEEDEVIPLARQTRPNIVILDLEASVSEGLSMLDRIREFSPHVVAILVFGSEMRDFARQVAEDGALECLYRPGVMECLYKPLDERTLLDAVGRATECLARRGEWGPSFEGVLEWPANRPAILEVLERACNDRLFAEMLDEKGSEALEGYRLTWEEKAALVSGDLRWIELHAGRLSERHRSWLNWRLQRERW